MGDSDVDTFTNITRAEYDFDDESFDNVSQDAKDFISSLLIHRKENRLTAEQCLATKWLTEQNEEFNKIPICTDKLKKFIIRRKWQVSKNCLTERNKFSVLFYKKCFCNFKRKKKRSHLYIVKIDLTFFCMN